MGIGDVVEWHPAKLPDWAWGNPRATVRGVDQSRNFFGEDSKPTAPTPGMAVLIILEANGLDVWVPPGELRPI